MCAIPQLICEHSALLKHFMYSESVSGDRACLTLIHGLIVFQLWRVAAGGSFGP